MRKKPPHKIVFVTGKGGVGKSSVAAATALAMAREGKSVLLVELGERSFYGPFLGLSMHEGAASWQKNLNVERWDMESALRELMAHYLLFSNAIADKVLNHSVMKALTGAAPNLSELAILGKLTASMRYNWYRREVDAVVVDAYATGQFMTLLRAPRGLSVAIGSGPMGRQTRSITDKITDPSICEYRIVTLPEELPVAEACELAADIKQEVGIAAHIVCNKVIDIPRELARAKPRRDDPAYAFVAQMRRIGDRQTAAMARLESVAQRQPVAVLPFVPTLDAAVLMDTLADSLAFSSGEGPKCEI